MSATLLREAVRRGLRVHSLAAGVTLALASAAMPAFAQDAVDAPGTQQLESVTVTGSRIRKADIETAQPIIVLDRAAIEKQGFNSVADILQNLTESGSPAISRAEALASGEDVGGYYVDLRNIGNNRTLILLNGKRLGATTSGSQDLSQIPMGAIERIEVLKDGASALYGSDAIAGVVNIITRSHFDGSEASAYVGQYDQGDGTKQTFNMTFGAHNERGSLTMSAEYAKEDPVWAKNRPFSAYNAGPRHPNSGLTPVSQWGAAYFPDGSCPGQDDSRYGACTLNPGGDPLNPLDYHGTNSAGGGSDLTNSNQAMWLQTGTERRSLFVSGDYSITDNIKFVTDALYNKRDTTQQIAGYPFQSGVFGIPLSADSYYNPFGSHHGYAEPTEIDFLRRGWEMPRKTESALQTYRISGGLQGNFDIGGRNWAWDVGGYVNTNDVVKTARGDFSLSGLQGALGPSFLDPATGLVTCGAADAPLPYGTAPGSCMPWNPMLPAGQGGSGSLGDPALQAVLYPYYHDTGRTKTVDYSANVTGSVFTLPAGDLGVAAGFETRRESGSYVPDAFSQAGLSTNLSSGPTGGSYSVNEYYLEVDVPLVKDVPFVRELSVNVAGRYSDYSTFGNTTNGKFSLTWKPIDDLLVRGNYAQGFRAPTIADLYGGLSGTFDDYTDPCDTVKGAAANNPAVAARCATGAGVPQAPPDYTQIGQGGTKCDSYPCQTGTQFFAGSNPALQAETATSKTLGIVYSPRWIQGLDFSLDWYRIRINNAIAADTAQDILDDCYLRNNDARCSALLFTRDANGVINYALRGNTNRGWIDTEGYDFGVNYRLPEFAFGRFALHWNTTYVAHNNSKATNDATVVETYTGLGSNFRTRSNASADWTLGDFGASWTTRYYSSIKENCSYAAECSMPDHSAPDTGAQPLNRSGANTFHDLQVRWNAPWKATISAGANNVFNHEGPVLYSKPNSTYSYYGGFDIGRFYYLRYNQTF